jgi:hypothetical protein
MLRALVGYVKNLDIPIGWLVITGALPCAAAAHQA